MTDEKLQEMIKEFGISTYTTEERYPGKLYQVITRITDEPEENLLFNRTVFERYYSESATTPDEYNDAKYAIKEINKELEQRRLVENSFTWNYIYCPYFTELEMPTALVYSEGRAERPYNDERSDEGINCLNYGNKVKELELRLKDTDDPDEINDIKTELISLGWNPEVEMTEANIIKAKNRIERIYTQHMNELCDIINISESIFNFDPNNSSRISVLNEATAETDVVPLFIIPTAESVKLRNRVDEDYAESSIYAIFLDRGIRDNILMLENTYNEFSGLFENTIFSMPSNYRAFQVVAAILENYQFTEKALIYKVKGELQILDPDTINTYTRHLANKPIYEHDIDNYRIYSQAVVLH